ncbi:MAG: CHAT domain-containing protein [Tolypothrix carrinoi HA7290-LM1]|jgi:WD40 repeat protein/energy-coupling factor transporter ATP-binding protein EcfA2|nr:CHAT domain-containing protein [Tolypothrix carrinoi HA7290-LM1]
MSIFEITIRPKDKNSWPVTIEYISRTGLKIHKNSTLNFKPNNDDIFNKFRELLWKPQDYGEMLGKALFDGNAHKALIQARSFFSTNKTSDSDDNLNCLHILLDIEDEELRQLRWEKLHAPGDDDDWDYLLLNQQTPLSFYIPSPITDDKFPRFGRRDLKALVVAASPENSVTYHLAPFDVQATVSSIKASLSDIPCDVLATVDGAAGLPTNDNLKKFLTENNYTLLHLVCHGRVLNDGETAIYLANEKNEVAPVKATDLIKELKLLRRLPHFAFLSTCESASAEAEVTKVDEANEAQIGEVKAIGGLAQGLVRDLGMPAVVAMTDAISINTVKALAATFYKQLRQHGYVDLALVEATAGLQGRYDITVPALFSRLGGKPLFSDTLDRPLTKNEIEFGLERLQKLLPESAPVLAEKLKQHIATLQRTLNADSDKAIEEKDKALVEVKRICSEALDLSFENLALGKEVPSYDARCPFQGLYPFHYEKREFFCGREKLIEELQQKLSEDKFLPVLGPSGSGKSSLIMAGLFPALKKKEPKLKMAYMTPKVAPLAQLKASLAKVQNHPYILVVDQFEEIFTLCNDEYKRQNFIDELLKLAKNQQVILTMRADFWGECAPYPELKDLMEKQQKLIAPMNTAELRNAIHEQAGKVGLRFEVDLLNKILEHLEGEPGAMPLLQHTLLELWNRRHGKWLLSEEYREIGGVQGAIAHTADEVYNKLSSEEKEQVRNIFVRLTHLDENSIQGEQRRDTRRRVELKQLVPANGDSAVIKKLVTLLANERLVITSQNESTKKEEVEVAHEALIRYWPTLRSWLDKDLTSLFLRQRIENEAREWEKAEKEKKEELLLLQGSRLEDAVELSYSKNTVCLDTLAREYVHACQQLEEKRQVDTKTQIHTAFTALSALAQASFGDDQLGALVYALKAGRQIQQLKESPWLEKNLHVRIQTLLQQTLSRVQERNRLKGGDNASSVMVSFSPDGQLLATAGDDGTIRLWNLQGQKLEEWKTEPRTNLLSFSPDRQLLATTGDDVTVRLWNLQGQKLKEWNADQFWLARVSFSPDGQQLATAGGTGIVRLWDLQGQKLKEWRATDKGWIWNICFSPDGHQLATVGFDGYVRLWDVQTLEGREWKASDDYLRSVSFSPDGQRFATAGDDGIARLWNLQEQTVMELEENDPKIQYSTVNFSPDGQMLATYGGNGTIVFWNLQGQKLEELKASQNELKSVSFSPDGRMLAVAGISDTAYLWDLQGQLLTQLKGDQEVIKSVSFNSDNQRLTTVGENGTVSLWNLQGQPLTQLKGNDRKIISVSFSQDGQQFVTAGDDGIARLWNLQGQLLKELPGNDRKITIVSFIRNGQQLATVEEDGTVRLWNLMTDQPPIEFPQKRSDIITNNKSYITSDNFSPDGQRLATIEYHDYVYLWDWQGQHVADTPVAHRGGISSFGFSPNNQLLATAGNDGIVRLWKLQDQPLTEQLSTWQATQKSIMKLKFSPDSQLLATAGADRTVRLWDLKGQPLARWRVDQGFVKSISFSPDGRLLATVGYRGNTKLLQIESLDELMQRGCDWVRDYLQNNPDVSESDRRLILDGNS